MDHRASVLEQMLQRWEDYYYLQSLLARHPRLCEQALGFQIRPHPFAEHWQHLRSYLLDACRKDEPFDHARFLGASTLPESFERQRGSFNRLPLLYWLWSRHSRRIFHPSDDLTLLLAQTSFSPEMDGHAIKLPFDAFAIEFDTPIAGVNGHDCASLMVGKITGPLTGHEGHPYPYLAIFIFPSTAREYQRIPGEEKAAAARDIARAVQGRKTALAVQHLRRFTRHVNANLDAGGSGFATLYFDTHALVEFARGEDVARNADMRIFRIVLGLILYLQTLPARTKYRSDWRPFEHREPPQPRAITSTAEVCSVTSAHVLSPADREILSRVGNGGGHELSAHFRSGHWRRPPGKGDDPTAAKIVWVSPTLVRPDRLEPGTLPAGSETVLT